MTAGKTFVGPYLRLWGSPLKRFGPQSWGTDRDPIPNCPGLDPGNLGPDLNHGLSRGRGTQPEHMGGRGTRSERTSVAAEFGQNQSPKNRKACPTNVWSASPVIDIPKVWVNELKNDV